MCELIVKHFDKNRDAIENGLNNYDFFEEMHILPLVIRGIDADNRPINCRKEFVQLYLNLSRNCKICIYDKELKHAIDICDKNKENDLIVMMQNHLKMQNTNKKMKKLDESIKRINLKDPYESDDFDFGGDLNNPQEEQDKDSKSQ